MLLSLFSSYATTRTVATTLGSKMQGAINATLPTHGRKALPSHRPQWGGCMVGLGHGPLWASAHRPGRKGKARAVSPRVSVYTVVHAYIDSTHAHAQGDKRPRPLCLHSFTSALGTVHMYFMQNRTESTAQLYQLPMPPSTCASSRSRDAQLHQYWPVPATVQLRGTFSHFKQKRQGHAVRCHTNSYPMEKLFNHSSAVIVCHH